MLNVNRAIGILQVTDYERQWQEMLQRLHDRQGVAPLLGGLATRLLFDKNLLTAEQAGTAMRFRLSLAQPPAEAVQWLEGFLYGSGLLLLHQPMLWGLLDAWMEALEEGAFRETLPLLRRTFSRFNEPERARMLALAQRGEMETASTTFHTADLPKDRLEAVLPLLRQIFR